MSVRREAGEREHSESAAKGNVSQTLPIAAYREALVEAVEQSACVVIVGETGSGKTTQLPQYLLEANVGGGKPIVVTQPRRVAAISVAQRVATERGCAVGEEVGYEVRFEYESTAATRLKYVTDGCLLRECTSDPAAFSKYGVVILDEAHIRSMDTDVLFGLAKQLLDHPGPGAPKLVVMSATLNAERFVDFFGGKAFRIPGRLYPVEIISVGAVGPADIRSDRYITECVTLAMEVHCTKPAGDILVFLTGQAEIDAAAKRLFKLSEELSYRDDVVSLDVDGLMILPMYGAMSSDDQARVFAAPPAGVRKLVLATDIASTSLTIDGVVYVIDSGFVKQKSFNPATGLDALQVVPISRSEASQRAGRAGRTRPGLCYRVYSEEFEEKCMEEFNLPEIQRTSLTSVVLTLKTLEVRNVLDFPYLDPPEERMLLEALKQLYYFDALDRDGQVTPMGKEMGRFPLSPSLSRVLLGAKSMRCAALLLPVVAMLCVEQIFVRPSGKDKAARANEVHTDLLSVGRDDFTNLLLVFDTCFASADPRRWCRDHFVHSRALQTASRTLRQLEELLDRSSSLRTGSGGASADALPSCEKAVEAYVEWKQHLPSHARDRFAERRPLPAFVIESIRRALCFGFFNHVARGAGTSFRTMDGHASAVAVHPSSFMMEEPLTDHGWVMYNEVVWTSRPYMRTITPIQYDWVKALLPKLHDVDVFNLSTSGVVEGVSASAGDVGSRVGGAEAAPPEKRRTTDAAVAAARERYLERKRRRVGGTN